jgi:uncharacterized OB-fold protein
MGDTDTGTLSAPNIIEYPFRRTTGPVVGAFLTGLREQVLVGIRASDGRVLCPPIENDPITGADLTEVVEVGPAGEVTTWAWNAEPQDHQPLDRAFAWALIKLDGADTALLHAVDPGDAGEAGMRTGLRVTARFREERTGELADLVCFVPEGGAA